MIDQNQKDPFHQSRRTDAWTGVLLVLSPLGSFLLGAAFGWLLWGKR